MSSNGAATITMTNPSFNTSTMILSTSTRPLVTQTSCILALPPELLLDILRRTWTEGVARSTVDQASNRWALRTLSLTCRAFRLVVRPRLFSSLSMMTGEQLEEIIMWSETADLGDRAMVTSLRFESIDAGCGETGELISQKRIAVLIASLPNIQRLYFGRFRTTSILPPLARVLRGLETLEALAINMYEGGRIEGIGGLLDCVKGLPRLTNLDIPSHIRAGIKIQTTAGPPLRELYVQRWHSTPAAQWAALFGRSSTIQCLHLGEADGRLDPHTRLPHSVTALCFDEIRQSTLEYSSKRITALSYRVRIEEDSFLYRPSEQPLLEHVKTLALNLVLYPGQPEISPAHEDDIVEFLRDLCTLPLERLALVVTNSRLAKPRSTRLVRDLIEKTMEAAGPKFEVTWGDCEQVDLLRLAEGKPAVKSIKWF